MRRQSTTEEILIARGFRRESTTEDIMRCRNFRRQSQVVTSHFHCHICKLTKGKNEIYMFRKFRSAFAIQAAGIMKKMKGGEG